MRASGGGTVLGDRVQHVLEALPGEPQVVRLLHAEPQLQPVAAEPAEPNH